MYATHSVATRHFEVGSTQGLCYIFQMYLSALHELFAGKKISDLATIGTVVPSQLFEFRTTEIHRNLISNPS